MYYNHCIDDNQHIKVLVLGYIFKSTVLLDDYTKHITWNVLMFNSLKKQLSVRLGYYTSSCMECTTIIMRLEIGVMKHFLTYM